MNKNFPLAMIEAAKLSKISFLSDVQPISPNDCKNCGGMGYFFLFLATDGPFQSPSVHKVNKWHNEAWYVGETQSYKCPDCGGRGKVKPAPERFVQHEMGNWDEIAGRMGLRHPNTGEILEEIE